VKTGGIVVIFVILLSLAWVPGGFGDEGPVVEKIEVNGGVTISADTVSYYLGVEEGDPLDRELLAEGFRRFWESGLVEDLKVEMEDLGKDKITLIVTLKERPIITSVLFEGNKKLSASDIKDRLDEKGIEVPRNVPLRKAELNKILKALEDIYAAEGYRSAKISYSIEEVSVNRNKVIYTIEEGAKVKISSIDFIGNEQISDSHLHHALKKIKEKKFYRFFGKKIIYSEESWAEDHDNLRDYYLDRGFVDVKIGKPQIELVAKHPDAKTLKKKKYSVKITIPVEEGEVYTLGSLTIDGAEVVPPDLLRHTIDAKEGKRYSHKVIDAGMETIRDIYHNRGYIYAYTNETRMKREGADHVVDVSVDIFEGERYKLGRLEFSGNTTTRDKVLRREFHVSEGTWMNMGLFKSSVYKVNALGYWKLEDEPLEFDFDEEDKKVNVTVKGKEVGRNDLQFGAGYSELDGFFAQASFSTRNFMGRGETLGISLQMGGRSDYYTLSFSEPYLFDRRILLGASLFSTSTDIYDYYRESRGATLTIGFGLGMWGSLSGLFAYENVKSHYAIERVGFPGDSTSGHDRPVDVPGLTENPLEHAYEYFDGRTVSFTPAYRFDTRDDPFDPNRGTGINFRVRMAGGPLGGDFDYIRPELTFTKFVPLSRKSKSIFAFNIEAGKFFPYNDSEIPLYELYRLGGDRTLRGFPYYSIRPRTAEGKYFYTDAGSVLGGDRFWLCNLEYQYRIGGPVKLVFFTDIGNTYAPEQGWDWSLYRQSYGAELRIFLPIFQAPIRFIYGIVVDPFPDEKSSDFQFSIGTTF